MGSRNLSINFFDISVISQREHPIDFPDFGRGAQILKRERDRRDAAILHPSVKSGDSWLPLRRFLLAVMRPNSSGRFRDPKSQIIRRRRMLLHFKQKFLLQSVRYAPFVWIAKCRDRAARTLQQTYWKLETIPSPVLWKYLDWTGSGKWPPFITCHDGNKI